jgi:Domain of unknown function (DUF4431)
MRVAHVVCAAVLLLATPAAGECLKANVDGQGAQGKLTVGRAKDAAGRPERPYILQLTANACLDAEDPDEAVKSTRTIHLAPGDEKLLPAIRKLVGKTVEVRGNPFGAHTAHHHAPIVMLITEIRAR